MLLTNFIFLVMFFACFFLLHILQNYIHGSSQGQFVAETYIVFLLSILSNWNIYILNYEMNKKFTQGVIGEENNSYAMIGF